MYIGLHTNCPLFGQISMKLEFSGQIFDKSSHIKLHENPLYGSRIFLSGRTDGQRDRQTDMTKLIVRFCNFATTPKNHRSLNE